MSHLARSSQLIPKEISDTTVIDANIGLRVYRWRGENNLPVICIRQGNFFIRIPLDRAYPLVNAVHDLAERIEQETQ